MMKAILGFVAAILYIGVGFVQFLAMIKGLQLWFSLPWLLAAFLSLLVAYIPFVGPIAGIYAATEAWGWDLWPAIAFFCGPYALYFAAIATGGIVDVVRRKRQEGRT